MLSTFQPISIRPAFPDDAGAIRRLAALDSAPAPATPLLVADVAGELRAAVSLRDGRAIADPFHPTADAVALLRVAASGGNGRGRSPLRTATGVWRALASRPVHQSPAPGPRRSPRRALSLNAWALLGAR